MSVFLFLSMPLPLNIRTYLLLSAFRLLISEVLAWGSWYVHFASCFYIDIYCIMGCYFTLCHNTYAYPLLFYKVYMKRENADSLDSGLEKEQILETYSAQLQKSETPRKLFLEIIKNIERKKYVRGAPPVHKGGGRALPPRACPPASWAPWCISSAQ